MLRTTLLACLLALAGYASAHWLTLDYAVWTAEGARRLAVARHPVDLPVVTVDGSGIPRQALPSLITRVGGVTLVDLVYTRCQTVCLSLGSSFQQFQAALQADRDKGTAHGVHLLSISFDGTHDTPDVLQNYARAMQADPTLWQWVRVPDAVQEQILLQRLGVVVVPNGRGDFEHNAAFLVVDGNGRLVRIFDLAEQQLALDFARHLAKTGQL